MHNVKAVHRRKYLLLHFLIFLWGFTAVLGKLVSLDALNLTWYRLGLAVAALALWRLWRRRPAHYTWRDYRLFVFNGILIALHWTAFFGAIKLGNVSTTLIALSSGAFFASLLEPLIYGRRVDYKEIWLGLLILGGIAYLFGISQVHFWAFLTAIAAAFLSALFSVWNGLLIRRYPALDLSFYELASGFGLLTLILVFTGQWIPPAAVPPADWIWILLLALVCTAYSFTVSLDLLRYINPFTLILSLNLEPVYGMILARIIFGESEKMNGRFYIGSAIILGIVLLNNYLKLRKMTGPAENGPSEN